MVFIVKIKRIASRAFLFIIILFLNGFGGNLSRAGDLRVDRDCKDFVTQEQAQAYFEFLGGSSTNNVDGLDGDHDGIACESNPSITDSARRKDSRIEVLSTQFSGEVIRVVDGDTLIVSLNSKTTTIRLSEIDCPEKNQAFGREATQFTAQLVIGKVVTLSVGSVDKYGRRVAKVILPDGQSLNRMLIKSGLAWWYEWFSNDTTLRDLETEARRQKIGLWQENNPLAPWDFRAG